MSSKEELKEYICCCGASREVVNRIFSIGHIDSDLRHVLQDAERSSQIKKRDRFAYAASALLIRAIHRYEMVGLSLDSSSGESSSQAMFTVSLDNIEFIARGLGHVWISAFVDRPDKYLNDWFPCHSRSANDAKEVIQKDIRAAIAKIVFDAELVGDEAEQLILCAFREAVDYSYSYGPPKRSLLAKSWKKTIFPSRRGL